MATLGVAFAGVGVPGDAAAVGISLPFTFELASGQAGDFGAVDVEEVGAGDLAFTVTLETSELGPSARLRNFYFNLAGDFVDDDDDDDWPPKGGRRDDDWPPKRGHRDDDKPRGRGHEGKHDGKHQWHKWHRDDDDRDDDDGLGSLRISGFRCNGGACDDPFELLADVTPHGADGASFDFGVDFGHGNEMLRIVSFILSAKSDLSLADVLARTSTTDGGIEALFAARVKGVGDEGDEKVTIGAIPEPATALLLGLGLAGLAASGARRRR